MKTIYVLVGRSLHNRAPVPIMASEDREKLEALAELLNKILQSVCLTTFSPTEYHITPVAIV